VDNKINGNIMMVLSVILVILYLALPTLLIYTYWLAVIALIGYGSYMFQR
jgi:hypothetical protein